jgi:hypothetical protein
LDGFGVFKGREVQFDFRRDLGGLQDGLGWFRQVLVVFDQLSVTAVQAGAEVAESGLAEGRGFAAAAVGFDMRHRVSGMSFYPLFSSLRLIPPRRRIFVG